MAWAFGQACGRVQVVGPPVISHGAQHLSWPIRLLVRANEEQASVHSRRIKKEEIQFPFRHSFSFLQV